MLEAGRGRACLFVLPSLGFTFKMQTGPRGHEGPFSNFGRSVEAGTAKLGDYKAPSPSLARGEVAGWGGGWRRVPAGLRSCALVEERACLGKNPGRSGSCPGSRWLLAAWTQGSNLSPAQPLSQERRRGARAGGEDPFENWPLQPLSLPRGAYSSFACRIFCLVGISIVSDTSRMI